ncbi:hypothetical protein [Hoeflea ulvae]|uniref:Uncharacterized protein n=1 Tax=Hoeflea ulvae TaxID=2983764 RepID=A0ABT3YHV0_9HYPH|nr:hypothetical protein [Hoeflea ulvae]MCY0095473.1 hypothetical protein [Hoeflea ulvae]
MAGQKAEKGKAPKKKAGGMMGMLSKVFALIAAVLASLFFAAMFDVAHLGLLQTLSGFAIGLVPLFAVLSIASMVLTPKPDADIEAQAAKIAGLSESLSKVTSQIVALQDQIDSLSGQDNETLKARNKELEAQLDAIHQVERDKVDGEIEALRRRNEELEEQIKKWAFEAVGKSISGEAVEPMKAA